MRLRFLAFILAIGLCNATQDDEETEEESGEHGEDGQLREFLGYNGSPVNYEDENWCPEECNTTGQIFTKPNLGSYCTCVGEDKLYTVQHYCRKGEIYNSTLKTCHKVLGDGFVTCVLNHKECPNGHIGIREHPNQYLYQSYIICLKDKVIVAQCTAKHYYDKEKRKCVKENKKFTILTQTDCALAPKIDCKEPGVVPLDVQTDDKKLLEACPNCYYVCNDRNLKTYELTIECVEDNQLITNKTKEKETSENVETTASSRTNISDTIENSKGTNPTTEKRASSKPTEKITGTENDVTTNRSWKTTNNKFTLTTSERPKITKNYKSTTETKITEKSLTGGETNVTKHVEEMNTTEIEISKEYEVTTEDLSNQTISVDTEISTQTEYEGITEDTTFVDITRSSKPHFTKYSLPTKETKITNVVEGEQSSQATTSVKTKPTLYTVSKITGQESTITGNRHTTVSSKQTTAQTSHTKSSEKDSNQSSEQNKSTTEELGSISVDTDITQSTYDESNLSTVEESAGTEDDNNTVTTVGGSKTPFTKNPLSTDEETNITKESSNEITTSVATDSTEVETEENVTTEDETIITTTTEEPNGVPSKHTTDSYKKTTSPVSHSTNISVDTDTTSLDDLSTVEISTETDNEVTTDEYNDTLSTGTIGRSKTPFTHSYSSNGQENNVTKSVVGKSSTERITRTTTKPVSEIIQQKSENTYEENESTTDESFSEETVPVTSTVMENSIETVITTPKQSNRTSISGKTEITLWSTSKKSTTTTENEGFTEEEWNNTTIDDTTEGSTIPITDDSLSSGEKINATKDGEGERSNQTRTSAVTEALVSEHESTETETTEGNESNTNKTIISITTVAAQQSTNNTRNTLSTGETSVGTENEGITKKKCNKTTTADTSGSSITEYSLSTEETNITDDVEGEQSSQVTTSVKTRPTLYTVSKITGQESTVTGITTGKSSNKTTRVTTVALQQSTTTEPNGNPSRHTHFSENSLLTEKINVTKGIEKEHSSRATTSATVSKITDLESTETTTEESSNETTIYVTTETENNEGNTSTNEESPGETTISVESTGNDLTVTENLTSDTNISITTDLTNTQNILSTEKTSANTENEGETKEETIVYTTDSWETQDGEEVNATKEVVGEQSSQATTERTRYTGHKSSETEIHENNKSTTKVPMNQTTNFIVTVASQNSNSNNTIDKSTETEEITPVTDLEFPSYSGSSRKSHFNASCTDSICTTPSNFTTTSATPYSEKKFRKCRTSKSRPCEREGYFRYKNSCTLHYQCTYKKKCNKVLPSRVYECPSCLKFHGHRMICDLPENVPECTFHKEDNQYVEGHQVTRPMKKCTGPGIFPDPSDRRRYYHCVDIFDEDKFYLTIVKCRQNETFNEISQKCDFSDVPRQPSKHFPGSCGLNNYAFDRHDCHKFYYCQGGKPYVNLWCSNQYFFNGRFCQHKSRSILCNWNELKKHLYR